MIRARFCLLGAGAALVATLALEPPAHAVETVIPNSALIPSTTLYTDIIGGGIGNIVVMTGVVGASAPGIGDPTGRNDDGSSGPIPLGFSTPLHFFGVRTSFFANNNGNISFDAAISAFTPLGPTGANAPIISAFFADVDTRGAGSAVLHLRTDIPNEIILTWDGVGYFASHDDKLNSFQMVVRGPDFPIPIGEGAIGFFYKNMQWETGDLSGGVGGFGGTPAAVGFGDGAGNGEVLEGSLHNGISRILTNHHIWFDPSLAPVPAPEPTSLLLVGGGLAALVLARRKK